MRWWAAREVRYEGEGRVGGVRVATLNLWGRRGAWDERRRVLAWGFRRLRPDLVAFQEAVVAEGYDQVTDILGPDYHLAHQTGSDSRHVGRVLLDVCCVLITVAPHQSA